jgi:glycerophosphoryl diester phosphodiesterase
MAIGEQMATATPRGKFLLTAHCVLRKFTNRYHAGRKSFRANTLEKKSLDWLYTDAIAHRGLHDAARGRIENSLSSALAAVDNGYSIEVDIQMAADGVPVVFHDATLDRLTGEKGRVRERASSVLGKISIGNTKDTIPTLGELLEAVGGNAGLVLELKGQDRGEDRGFSRAVGERLETYNGPVAIMSFNHWLLEDFAALRNDIPIGLTAEGDDSMHGIHAAISARIDFDFISYKLQDLPCKFANEFRKSGRPVITWTVRSPEDARYSSLYADQITFEGFLP